MGDFFIKKILQTNAKTSHMQNMVDDVILNTEGNILNLST